MEIYVYSDESGVFDNKNETIFIYGGLVFFSKQDKENAARKYKSSEETIKPKYAKNFELKGSRINNTDKGKLLRALNRYMKFVVAINLQDVHPNVFENKFHKQRFLDYAYTYSLKLLFESFIKGKIISPKK